MPAGRTDTGVGDLEGRSWRRTTVEVAHLITVPQGFTVAVAGSVAPRPHPERDAPRPRSTGERSCDLGRTRGHLVRVQPGGYVATSSGWMSVDVEVPEGEDGGADEDQPKGTECGETRQPDAVGELVVADGPEEWGEPPDSVDGLADGGEGAHEVGRGCKGAGGT